MFIVGILTNMLPDCGSAGLVPYTDPQPPNFRSFSIRFSLSSNIKLPEVPVNDSIYQIHH